MLFLRSFLVRLVISLTPCTFVQATDTARPEERGIWLGPLLYPLETESIQLQDFSLNVPLSPTLGQLTNLKVLEVRGGRLRQEIPESLSNLQALTVLNLEENALSGDIPESLGALTNLEELNLGCNRLTGTLPHALEALTSLRVLLLQSNHLEGSLPLALSKLTCLEELNVGHNRLTGSLPTQLFALKALKCLLLDRNHLTGEIPEGLGNLNQLETLQLQENELSGALPSSVGKLTSLSTLILAHNHLTGAIPESLGHLTGLEVLDLSHNHLTGDIPESLRHLTGLNDLNLSYNQLTKLPSTILDLSISELNLEGNCLVLEGVLPCDLISCHCTEAILGLGGDDFDPRLLYRFSGNSADHQVSFSLTALKPDHPLFPFNNTIVSFAFLRPNVLSIATLKDPQGNLQQPTQWQQEALAELNKAMEPFSGRHKTKKADF